jgi:hypothetical protein
MEFLMSKECYVLVEKFLAERMAQIAPSTDIDRENGPSEECCPHLKYSAE